MHMEAESLPCHRAGFPSARSRPVRRGQCPTAMRGICSLPRRGYITSVGQRPMSAAPDACRLKAYHHDARLSALILFSVPYIGRCPMLSSASPLGLWKCHFV